MIENDDINRLIKQIKDIVDGNGMIFVLYGPDSTRKSSLVQLIKKTVNAATVPMNLLKNSSYYINKDLKSQIMNTDYLIVDDLDFDKLKSAAIMTTLVHGEYFCRGDVFGPKKLIIVTNHDPNETRVFISDPGFVRRCSLIRMN